MSHARTFGIATISLVFSIPASYADKVADEMTARAVDGVVIARLAEENCNGMYYVDENVERNILSRANFSTWTEIPRSWVSRFSSGFVSNKLHACLFAWEFYGGGNATNQRGRLLYMKSPFGQIER